MYPRDEDKISDLNEYIDLNKRVNEAYYQRILEYQNQLSLVQSTKAWKVMCLLRRINEQLLKGSTSEKRKFFKWSLRKIINKPISKELELENFSPINSINIQEYRLPELEIASVSTMESQHTTMNTFASIPKKIDILRFPVIEWDFRWQRPQQLSMQFKKNGHRVFYFSIDTHGVKNQNSEYKDIVNHTVVKELQENVYWVKLCTNEPLNAYRDKIAGLDLTYMKWSIEYLKQKFNIGATYSILDLPFWAPIATSLSNNKVIYDCMDDHEGFSTNSSEMLSEEGQLIESSDMVLASSQRLYEKLINKNPNTILVRNAGEFTHFSIKPNTFPDELQHIKSPIIGYYGAISEWFDIKLIEQLAKRNKNWTFVLVGNTFGCDITNAEKLENIILTGEVPYSELPGYLYKFDICLIPFLINNLTLATNPVKVYEYLAAGKPVIATRLPELEYMSDLVYLADSVDEFEKSTKKALIENDEEKILKRKEYAKSNTWQTRYKEIESYILKNYPKVSIVIVTYNNWTYTKQCLDSLFKNNEYPNTEIIVVDNNSTDETRLHLANINQPNVKIVLSPENLGFAGGNKVGCNMATGDYIILLNNDTVVTQDWIETLIKPLRENKDLGMVGPVSNSVGNDQMLDFFIGDSISGPSKEWLEDFKFFYKGRYRNTDLLGFYCVAIKREVYEKAGDLDTNYGIGMFEDDDYCEKVKSLGYKLAIVEDAFVYHHGSASFKKLESEFHRQLWDKNKAYFESKWNKKWTMPKPPASIFLGVTNNDDCAKVVRDKGNLLSPILVTGEWNDTDDRLKEFVLKVVSKQNDILLFVCTEKYNNHEFHGLRKVGNNVYFTNNFDIISKIQFDKVITFKNDKIPGSIKAKEMFIDNSVKGIGNIPMQDIYKKVDLKNEFDSLVF